MDEIGRKSRYEGRRQSFGEDRKESRYGRELLVKEEEWWVKKRNCLRGIVELKFLM